MKAEIGWFDPAGMSGALILFQLAFGVSVQAASVSLPSSPSGFSTLPTAPNGFSGAVATLDTGSGLESRILEGVTIVTSLAMTYDSNITQSPGLAEFPVEDDAFLTLGGAVKYLSKASELTFGGDYHGSYSQYFQNADYSGFSQGASLTANYEVGRFRLSGAFGADYNRGANRNYGSVVVDQTTIRSSLAGRYLLSPKTSLAGNFSQSFTTSSGGFNETQYYDLGASALWKYSPLTEVGPGIRYTYTSDGTGDGRTSIGPTVSLNYKLSSKVSLNSRLGMDFATYEDGASADPTFSTSMALNYRASRLWGMNLSLYRDTQADPRVSGGYYEVTALRIGYNRKIQRATLNLGMSYETTSYTLPVFTGVVSGNDPIPTAQPDRDYFSLDGSLGMLIFGNSSYASVFVRYNDQSGGGLGSWDSFQTGISISRNF